MQDTVDTADADQVVGFPIFPHDDFDMILTERIVPVGFQSTYPVEWRRRVVAAMISGQLGYSSVDYVLKRYLKEVDYEEGQHSRPDLVISRRVVAFLETEADLLKPVFAKEGDPIGTLLCEMTLTRVASSFKAALTLANRGLLFEAVAVCRMAIEQIGWSFECHGIREDDQIRDVSASRTVSNLRKAFPPAGRLYGWLSRHLHWQFPEHAKIVRINEKDVTSILASDRFKAEALAIIVACLDCFGATLESLYAGKLANYLVLDPQSQFKRFREDREPVQLMSLLVDNAPKDAAVREIATLMA